MFLDFKREVNSLLTDALKSCGFYASIAGTGDLWQTLEITPHADLASNISFRLAPILRRSPSSVAEEIQRAISLDGCSFVDRVEVAGPYLNFFLSRRYLSSVLALAQGDFCWTGQMNERVIVEHTSANPNGPLHVGHIRNSVIGDTLARILRRAGCDVETQYYVNDMGRQIAIVVWGYERYGLEEKKPDHAIASAYIRANRELEEKPDLVSEVDHLMQRYEGGDLQVALKFKEAVDLALAGIGETLHRLNVAHDSYHWEGKFVRSGDASDIVKILERSGRTVWEDGALKLDLFEEGFEKKVVLKRADGTTLYVTRDLAYHRWKAGRCERMIDVLGADHKLISGQLRAMLRLMKLPEPEVVIFEFVSLPTGSMSTRKGKFISADDLLDEVFLQAYREVTSRRPDESEEFRRGVAEEVARGAVRYDIIKVSPDKATTFDWKSALDFEKLSAPFIQYSHARACSILRKAGEIGEFDSDLLTKEDEVALLTKISQFDMVIETAARDLKPHLLATYARELAESFNQFYRYSPVLDAEPNLRSARLALVNAARCALKATLETLGIAALEAM